MTFRVFIVPEAIQDLDRILGWLRQHSLAGAASWYHRWQAVIKQLEDEADRSSLAPESEGRAYELRQLIFKTRRGKPYRVIFTIRDDEDYLLHLRGPGQNLLTTDEIRHPPAVS